jgi:hypothetical protein
MMGDAEEIDPVSMEVKVMAHARRHTKSGETSGHNYQPYLTARLEWQ